MFSFTKKSKNQSVAAIVPGEAGLSVVSISPGVDKPHLDICDFSLWEDGVSHDQLLSQKVKEFSLAKRDCTTVMNLGDYSVLSVDAPDVPVNELRAAVRWQIKDLIDFHIDDAVIDVFDAPDSGAQGQQKKLYVVVSKTSVVRDRVDQLENADVKLATIDVPELVIRNITSRLPENEAGVAMIYLTRERGLIVVTRQSTLYFARSLEMGYEYLTQGLDDGSGLSFDSSPGNNVAFDKLVLEVQRSLDYYDRYFMQPPVSGLVIAPTAVAIPNLDEYLHESLGLSVRYLDLSEVIDTDEELSMTQQAHYLPAIGAALREEIISL